MLKDIKGVGPKTLSLLNKLGIYTVEDLVDYFPFRYNTIAPTRLEEGEVVITGIIETMPMTTYIKRNLNKLSFRIETDEQLVNVTIFNRAFMKNNLRRGMTVTVLGEYDEKRNTITANNIMLKEITDTYIEPVYHVTSGITSKLVGNLVKNALDTNPTITDYIPEHLVEKYDYPDKNSATRLIHNPEDLSSMDRAIERSKYEELFRFMFKINYLKSCRTEVDGLFRDTSEEKVDDFINSLSFNLTPDQTSAIRDIVRDLKSSKRMNRLLLGDVGSGKTIVAVASVYYNAMSGYQSALLVPTEILATQHYFNIAELFKKFGLRVELLKGKTSKKEREVILGDLANGEIDLLIGTHAVLEDDVVFKNLGLVITDEQHRFGVRQRGALNSKGTNPDVLVMSATPIPRTLALILYGDLDISIIDELPPNRQKIETCAVTPSKEDRVNNFLKEQIKEGRQIYVVCPLVEESEEINAKSVLEIFERYKNDTFKDFNVEYLHGKMKPKEKEQIMQDFKDKKIDILISTTVIEVGVDVPNASVMVIENAERFGLATLHQLRGRVGRGKYKSYCILKYKGNSEQTRERMKIMVETNDGFKVSEKDLEMRGSGEFFGTKQHGLPEFKIANLFEDMQILKTVQSLAIKILQEDKNLSLEKNKILRNTINKKFKERVEI